MKPLRILYVGANYKYINPTYMLFPCALSQAGHLYFYGPGYHDKNILEKVGSLFNLPFLIFLIFFRLFIFIIDSK